jgi:hypothetical protein
MLPLSLFFPVLQQLFDDYNVCGCVTVTGITNVEWGSGEKQVWQFLSITITGLHPNRFLSEGRLQAGEMN